jgi:fused signal recognition particle receptor
MWIRNVSATPDPQCEWCPPGDVPEPGAPQEVPPAEPETAPTPPAEEPPGPDEVPRQPPESTTA